ncbi:sensor histidine kinase [Aromatoleum diolicum]|uniref:histidine kinase n=1 Tax=Aromatoleum diolicum TaxID=75796 RepID=A0ABX1QI58_9RHOO|nr:sensor histidine kinase [Aromatoleum diolicum]NMG76919.1 sensor histidine kinase [Aromatoleum diolicum]
MSRRRTVVVITLTYALFAGLWIASSDTLLSILVEDSTLRMQIGSAKGFVYVAVTTLLLYLLLDSWRLSTLEAEEERRRPRLGVVLTAFLGLALVVPVIGVAVVRLHGRQIELEAYANLQTVAELKARQIQSWLAERDGDGRALAQSSGFALRLARWLNSGVAAERDLVQDRLSSMQSSLHYEGVVLLDANGRTVYASGSRREVPAAIQSLMAQARVRGDVVRSDLYLDESDRLHLDWIVPIRNPQRPSENVIAFVLLHVEPDRALYPLILSWHAPSPTAESFLVRREADSVVYLNELRHRVGAPLSLRLPLTTDGLPAAAAIANGEPLTMTGIDYRGVSVLAATRSIADTPWHLVAKVDREEVMAPLRNLVWWVSLVTICAIAAVAALILMYLRQQRRADRWAVQAEASERIRELNAQLEQRVIARTRQLAEANRELESFAYAVSHDLKAPLRGIIGYSRLLETEYSQQLVEEGRDFVCQINHAAMQMHQLIDDLLAYSRIERGTIAMTPTDLPAFVDGVLANCRPAIVETGAKVSVNIPRVTVPLDSNGLSMALRNVIDNAVKFSSHATPPRIEIGAHIGPASCVIWVRDNGIGFDMKFHDRMFEVFSRLDSNGDFPGTGVGLGIVRKAMQRMGGQAWAEGEIGRGACFFLKLPLMPTAA